MRGRRGMPVERDELVGLLSKEGFGDAKGLAALALRCAMVVQREPREALRQTYLGGLPQLDGPWPCSREGRALAFMGQIDLADLRLFRLGDWLPSEGVLGFFYDLDAWAGPPSFVVTRCSAGRSRIDRAPDGVITRPLVSVGLVPSWSLPPGGADCPFLVELGYSIEQAQEFADFVGAQWLEDTAEAVAQIGGYASAPNNPYVGAALDLDEGLRAEWFSRPVAERVRPDARVASVARGLRLLLDVYDVADGASLSFLVEGSALRRGLVCGGSEASVAAWLEVD